METARRSSPDRAGVALRVAVGFAAAWGLTHEIHNALHADSIGWWVPGLSLAAAFVGGSLVGLIPGVIAARIWTRPTNAHLLLGAACGLALCALEYWLQG